MTHPPAFLQAISSPSPFSKYKPLKVISTPIFEAARSKEVILFRYLCALREALPGREDEMALCLWAFREHLLGVSTLVPHCARGDRCRSLHGASQKYMDFGTMQGALKSGVFITPVIARFITFFLYGMSTDPGGEAGAKLGVEGKVHKTVVILDAAVLSLSLYV